MVLNNLLCIKVFGQWLNENIILQTNCYTLTSHRLHNDYTLTALRLPTDDTPTTHRLHNDYILTTHWLHTDYTTTTHWRHKWITHLCSVCLLSPRTVFTAQVFLSTGNSLCVCSPLGCKCGRGGCPGCIRVSGTFMLFWAQKWTSPQQAEYGHWSPWAWALRQTSQNVLSMAASSVSSISSLVGRLPVW